MLKQLQQIENRISLVTPRLIYKKPHFLLRALYRKISETFRSSKLLQSSSNQSSSNQSSSNQSSSNKSSFNQSNANQSNAYSLSSYPLRGVLFATHYKCNLNCRHCYEKKFYNTHYPLLTLDEKKRIIAQCIDLGVISFDFIGGETSLSPEFPELVKACCPSKTYISIATNGYDLSEKKIRYYKSIGVDKISVSIDSWYPDEHDFFRRKSGSHKRAFLTVQNCLKIGIGVHIGMVVYKGSTKTDGFTKMVEYSIKNKIRLGLIPAVPLGNWEADLDNLITPEDRKIMDSLHDRYPFITSDNYGNRYGGCPAFNEVITITAYGDVLPCDFIHISFGNLRNESLRSIVEKGRRFNYFNGRYKNCLAAESKEFLDKYLSKTYGANPYPIRIEDIRDFL